MESESKLTEIDWARLAAFIDGEGCISIAPNNLLTNGRTITYTFQVNVTNTDTRILFWIRSIFGGRVYMRGCPRKANHRQSYQWVAQSRKLSAWILRGCLPYFLSKREQAIIALDLYGRMHTTERGRGKKIPLPEATTRNNLVSTLRTLKRVVVQPAEPLN